MIWDDIKHEQISLLCEYRAQYQAHTNFSIVLSSSFEQAIAVASQQATDREKGKGIMMIMFCISSYKERKISLRCEIIKRKKKIAMWVLLLLHNFHPHHSDSFEYIMHVVI